MRKLLLVIFTLTLLLGLFGCSSNDLKSGYYYAAGEYEEFMTPYVSLNFDDNTLSFGEGTLLSYAENGSFQVKRESITATTQNATFIFKIKDSSTIILIDCENYAPFAKYEGTEFTYRIIFS